MGASIRTDRISVAAQTESGRLCTVTVQPDLLGKNVLRYEGSENTAAMLTPEVIELLTVALSVRGRSAIPARCPSAGACTLLVFGYENGRTSLYFHASTATSAVFDAKGTQKLRAALESLGGTGC